MHSLVIASNNRHKLEEIKFALRDRFVLKTLKDIGCHEELAEDQDTIEGNSLQKAEYVYKNYNVDCFADDSGLEAEALNGEPGVISAHYAGPQRSHDDNIELLLKNLADKSNKRARFKTVITLIWKGDVHTFEGIVDGTILFSRRGTNGFGYDPVFLPEGFSKTLAEMTMEEKNQISHRAIAVRKLANFLTTQS
ncbi:MAG TPA: RdgB/HAM1 family non-canonical purine NTP pyrophosphatase [Cyclobacteriaceae bacterium]|nr:RdgB/HAM1 family non-canonical purine NTP pyrophosphatase [Cyclobacteriaceae bacterium]